MPSQLIPRLTQRLFGNPIITNVVRGEIVEEIVAMGITVTGNYGDSALNSSGITVTVH
jgi:hypothetical protein